MVDERIAEVWPDRYKDELELVSERPKMQADYVTLVLQLPSFLA